MPSGACRSCCSCWLPPPPIQKVRALLFSYYIRTSCLKSPNLSPPSSRRQEVAVPVLYGDGTVYVFLHSTHDGDANAQARWTIKVAAIYYSLHPILVISALYRTWRHRA
jgi:hypothetical protein